MKKLLITIFLISLSSSVNAIDIPIPAESKENIDIQTQTKDQIAWFFGRNEKFQDLKRRVEQDKLAEQEEARRIEAEAQAQAEAQAAEKAKELERTITDGKGIWVNIWNYPKNTDSFMARLNKYHIDTIYLQINRSTTPIFYNKTGLDAVLKAAHEHHIKVIGWSYCYLKDIETDTKKFTQPALYRSPDGESLDGMAADIEENVAQWAVDNYTKKIKKTMPKNYPLIAIVFSPRIKKDYPWEYIGHNWDILMPMTYWHGIKNRNDELVYNFVKDSIVELRRLTKRDDLKIHLITDGDRTHSKEVRTSLEAARDHGINAGISVYPEHLVSDDILEIIKDY